MVQGTNGPENENSIMGTNVPGNEVLRTNVPASIIGMVRQNLKRLDKEDFLVIYKTYIRPHLEYCIQAWSPHLIKDIQVAVV